MTRSTARPAQEGGDIPKATASGDGTGADEEWLRELVQISAVRQWQPRPGVNLSNVLTIFW